jgi:hypothetical protein
MGTPLLHRPQGLVCLQFSQVYEFSWGKFSVIRAYRRNESALPAEPWSQSWTRKGAGSRRLLAANEATAGCKGNFPGNNTAYCRPIARLA